jgi:hypothetical protein
VWACELYNCSGSSAEVESRSHVLLARVPALIPLDETRVGSHPGGWWREGCAGCAQRCYRRWRHGGLGHLLVHCVGIAFRCAFSTSSRLCRIVPEDVVPHMLVCPVLCSQYAVDKTPQGHH